MPTIEVVQGFPHVDGAPAVTTRQRVVWTREEQRRLDRCAKDFHQHGDKLQLKCGNATCPDPFIKMEKDATNPGGAVLRCGCSDRLFPRKVG